jgi:hypothetical protein
MLVILQVLACSSEAPAPPAMGEKGGRHVAPMSGTTRPAAVESEESETPAKVRNRGPLVETIRIKPASPSRLDTITATVRATDPDGDRVSLEYEWWVNGKKVPWIDRPELNLAEYQRGDKVVLKVEATDLTTPTLSESDEVIIGNAAPQFLTTPADVKSINNFTIKAEDPDGDPIVWSAAGGPASFSIDAKGTMHWKGSPDDAGGQFTVKITAADAFEGVSVLELPLNISAGKPGRLP